MNSKSIIIIFLSVSILSACANIAPPSGGKPDMTPPEVIDFSPTNFATNFRGDAVRLEYNRYISKGGFAQAITISPDVNYKINWSGRTAEIEFVEDLAAETTYILSIGTDFKDFYNAVKPENSFSLVFSTGSIIDTGSITGKVYGKDVSGNYVYAYYLGAKKAESLDITSEKAGYRVQLGTSGEFELKGLKDGNYLVVAVSDQFQDAQYTPGIDRFGASQVPVSVTRGKSGFIPVSLGIVHDISSPEAGYAEPYNENYFTALFSEALDVASVNRSSFVITDEAGESREILAAYVHPANYSQVAVITEALTDTSRRYTLTALADAGEFTLRDTTGNFINAEANRFSFQPESAPAIVPKIDSVAVRDSVENISLDEGIDFWLNYPVKDFMEKLSIEITNLEAEGKLSPTLEKLNDVLFRIKVVPPPANRAWYRLTLSIKNAESITGIAMSDTLITRDFRTFDRANLTSISGTLDISGSSLLQFAGKDIYIRASQSSGKAQYETKVNQGEWQFNEIKAGTYVFEAYIDINSNGKYDFGEPYPYHHAEPLTPLEPEVKALPRWEVEDVKLTPLK